MQRGEGVVRRGGDERGARQRPPAHAACANPTAPTGGFASASARRRRWQLRAAARAPPTSKLSSVKNVPSCCCSALVSASTSWGPAAAPAAHAPQSAVSSRRNDDSPPPEGGAAAARDIAREPPLLPSGGRSAPPRGAALYPPPSDTGPGGEGGQRPARLWRGCQAAAQGGGEGTRRFRAGFFSGVLEGEGKKENGSKEPYGRERVRPRDLVPRPTTPVFQQNDARRPGGDPGTTRHPGCGGYTDAHPKQMESKP